MSIRFRPHHFLCTIGFEGKGYSPDFVTNYRALKTALESDPNTEIEVTSHTDSICSACPSKQDLLCDSQEKITRLDDAHRAVLGVKDGERYTWRAAKDLVKRRFTREAMDVACSACSWKAYGMCERALDRLKAEDRVSPLLPLLALALLTPFGTPSPARAATPEKFKAPHADLSRFYEGWRNFEEGNLESAERKITAVTAHDLRDHRTAALALIHRAQGDALVVPAKAERLYRASYTEFLSIRKNFPDSPWIGGAEGPGSSSRTNLVREASLSELRLARALQAQGKSATAVRTFHEVLGRLFEFTHLEATSEDDITPSAQYYLLSFADLRAYADACTAAGTSLCTNDLRTLISYSERTVITESRNGKAIDAAKEAIASERAYLLSRFPKFADTPNDYWKRPDELERLRKSRDQKLSDAGILDRRTEAKAKREASTQFSDSCARDLRRAFVENDLDAVGKITERWRAYFTAPGAPDVMREDAYARMEYWGAVTSMDRDTAGSRRRLEALAQRSPIDYYGMLAARAVGKSPIAFIGAVVPAPAPLPADEPFARARARTLLDYDLKFFAAIDLQADDLLSSRSTASERRRALSTERLVDLARLLGDAGLHYTSLSVLAPVLLERHDPKLWNRRDLELFFPREYLVPVRTAAEKQRLDPLLPESLIRRESVFEPAVLSGVQALGLMQLMSYTARTLPDATLPLDRVRLLGIEGGTTTNIELGTAYLASLIGRWKNVAYAIASYNAGPAALSAWLNPALTASGDVPRALRFCAKDDLKSGKCKVLRTDRLKFFIETIPYAETRKYVANILRNFVFYKELYENVEIEIDPAANAAHPLWLTQP